MPLRAVLADRDVIASDMAAPEWELLKTQRDELRMSCCGVRAVMRVSKLGLRHFAHYTRDLDGVVCDWKPESEDHLRAKMEIISACRVAGWSVQPEARAEDGEWRADVLAWRNGRHGVVRVAFEVQLSPQSRAETEMRQARYAEAGIRGCWFVRPRGVQRSIQAATNTSPTRRRTCRRSVSS
jgi:competence CoiA-like predicted nuclease